MLHQPARFNWATEVSKAFASVLHAQHHTACVVNMPHWKGCVFLLDYDPGTCFVEHVKHGALTIIHQLTESAMAGGNRGMVTDTAVWCVHDELRPKAC